ncbi:MAG: hypothetical protein ACR2HH_10455 [Chthoniobacterales bacterium]
MMKTPIPLPQIALLVGALVAGILLDRLVLASDNSLFHEPAPRAAAAPAATFAATVPTTNAAAVAEPKRSTAASQSASRKSLDAILALTDPRQRTRDLQTYISALTPTEFAEALKRFGQITSSNERELASRLLVAQWVQTDPDGALQFAAANHRYEYLAEDVFQQFAAGDFDSALKRALAIPGSDLRYQALRGVLSFKADSDPRGALQLAQTFGDFRGNEPLASAIYRQWAATNPQAAALQAANDPQGDGWRSPVNSVVQTWAQQDPRAAADWSMTLADAQAQERSISQVMRQWARQDPKAASDWIYRLDAGPSHDAAIAGFAQSLISTDAQTALSWIGTITDDATRTRALQRVSGEIMWRDPQNGAALLQAAGLPADQIRNGRRGRSDP